MENRKNKDKEIFWYELNLALAKNASERRRVKREWDRNLLNSRVVNTLHAIVLVTGITLGTYQAYKNGANELPYSIYETNETRGYEGNKTYLDDLLTITLW